jgi:hypothetical protein
VEDHGQSHIAMTSAPIAEQTKAPERKPAQGDSPEHILQFFAWAHLPPHLQVVSQPFGELATRIVDTIPRNPERTVALRKLLEAKDAAVRAVLARGT